MGEGLVKLDKGIMKLQEDLMECHCRNTKRKRKMKRKRKRKKKEI